ncbi:hypothetical protein [Micromonospora okii]|uniref:hypothetical protein n=1 Tax=Micromonospora okii TaxID=1182970 RepID=UPI001E5E57E3|nr:hypothetical protein [Micromonospora okii]
MQRRLVAVAPVLVGALLLHLGVACRPPLAAPDAPRARPPAAAPTRPDPPPAMPSDAESRATAEPRATGGSPAARVAPVRLAAHVAVAALTARTGQPPERTVVANFAGKACGSVTRPGRNSPTSDRRDPVTQAASAPPDAPLRRDNTAAGRPIAAVACPEAVRPSVLRC